MSKDNDNIDINLSISKDRFKTQATLFIGLVVVYILSHSTPVHIVCIALGVLDIVALCMQLKTSNKERTAPEKEDKVVQKKPREKTRVQVNVTPEPSITDNESTTAVEESAENNGVHNMTESDWADFFASLDGGK